MVKQILAHISNTPLELIKYCQDNRILVEAYSPFGHRELFKNDEIKAIADRYNVSVSQLAIRYCLQLDLLPLPKSQLAMKTNAEVDFVISEDDLKFLKEYGAH